MSGAQSVYRLYLKFVVVQLITLIFSFTNVVGSAICRVEIPRATFLVGVAVNADVYVTVKFLEYSHPESGLKTTRPKFNSNFTRFKKWTAPPCRADCSLGRIEDPQKEDDQCK